MRNRNRIIAAVQAVLIMLSFYTASMLAAAAAELEEMIEQQITADLKCSIHRSSETAKRLK